MSKLNNENFTLIVRQGTASNLALSTTYVSQGELMYTTDTKTLYVGDASNNKLPVAVQSAVINLLSSTTGVNAKTVANTALYTVPSGKTAVITGYVVKVSAASSITGGPTAGIGNTAGTNNIGASQAMNALLTTTDTFQWSIIGSSKTTVAAGIVYFNLGTVSTGTSQTITIDLFGYTY